LAIIPILVRHMEPVTIIAMVVALAAVVVSAVGLFFVRKKGRPEENLLLLQQQLDSIREQLRSSLDGNSKLVHQQISELTAQIQTQLHRQTGTISDSRKAMDERLDNAARVIGDVKSAMGRIHESLAPIGELRDILRAPKMRGGFGEVMLEQLLEEMLPSNMYDLQCGLGAGDRVDAAVRIGGQIVPIDSKFPLEKYHEYIKASSEEEKKQSKKGLISAVKKHADDVSKYIKPDQGTYPFALMYIPSESIFYELFIAGEASDGLWAGMAAKRVFPVSSNTLYIYLQTISFGLKGMQIAEHARELLNKLEQVQKNLVDVRKTFEKIGTHLKNAHNAYEDTEKKFDKLETKFTALGTEEAKALAEPAKKSDEDSPPVQ